MKKKLRIAAAALAAAALLALAGASQASAAPAPERTLSAVQPGPNTVGTTEIKTGGVQRTDLGAAAVWGPAIHDNTIPLSKMGYDFRQAIEAANVSKADAIKTSAQVKAGAIDESDLAASVQAKLNASPTNVAKSCAAVVVQHTGGSFKTLKTKVCEFNLPAGTWMINTSAFFARTVAGVEGVRPQLALRVGASDTVFGDDYGTILGAEISATANRELTGSAVKVVTVPAGGVTVEVFGHGYQDNTGDDGAKIAAAADVVAVKIAA